MAVSMTARWDNSGTVIPAADAEYVVAEQPIAEYDNWFNYSIVADIQAVIDDVIDKFNANTILKADTDNTPAALVVAEQTIVGRKTGSSIAALTATEVRTILVVENGSTADQTGAEIKTLYEAEANAYTDTKNTKLTGIDTGADVTADNPPQSHGASVHTDRTRTVFCGSHHYTSGGTSSVSVTLDATTDEAVSYRMKIPEDFSSLVSAKVMWTVNTTSGLPLDWVLNIGTRFGKIDESHFASNLADNGNVVNITSTMFQKYNAFTIDSSALTGLETDDFLNITITRDADNGSDTFGYDIYLFGVLLTYTADM
jgi:hypothetical protein